MDTEVIYIYICLYIYTHTHIHIYIHIHFFLQEKLQKILLNLYVVKKKHTTRSTCLRKWHITVFLHQCTLSHFTGQDILLNCWVINLFSFSHLPSPDHLSCALLSSLLHFLLPFCLFNSEIKRRRIKPFANYHQTSNIFLVIHRIHWFCTTKTGT